MKEVFGVLPYLKNCDGVSRDGEDALTDDFE
jgi:hypothetical protein